MSAENRQGGWTIQRDQYVHVFIDGEPAKVVPEDASDRMPALDKHITSLLLDHDVRLRPASAEVDAFGEDAYYRIAVEHPSDAYMAGIRARGPLAGLVSVEDLMMGPNA